MVWIVVSRASRVARPVIYLMIWCLVLGLWLGGGGFCSELVVVVMFEAAVAMFSSLLFLRAEVHAVLSLSENTRMAEYQHPCATEILLLFIPLCSKKRS
jgi:hypothetical protein